MKKKKHKDMKHAVIDYREIVTQGGEKRRYLFTGSALKEDVFNDVEAGATIYKPIIETMKGSDLGRRVRILKVSNLESGLRGVLYIAGFDNYIDNVETDRATEEIEEGYLSQMELNDEPFILPVISAREVCTGNSFYSVDDGFRSIPFGNLSLGGKYSKRDISHFFDFQSESPVIVFCQSGMYGFDYKGLISRFSQNRRVYLLWINQFYDEDYDDPELAELVISADATCISIEDKDNDTFTDYLSTLSDSISRSLGLTYKNAAIRRRIIDRIATLKQISVTFLYAQYLRDLLKRVAETSNTIGNNVLKLMCIKPKEAGVSGQEKMSTFVGMENVKKELERFISSYKFAVLRRKAGLKSTVPTALVMMGDSGTGKTEVAKALGKRLADEGYLPTNKFISISGTEMCAEYLGMTRSRVQEIFASAAGGVLFIDEAYSLNDSSRNGDGPDLYSKQAVTQMLIELDRIQESSSNTLVIFAGYSKPMEHFMDTNPGLRSRVSGCILRFSPYDEFQATDIFYRICEREGYIADCSEELKKCIADYFKKLSTQSGYGNGRAARNLVMQTILSASERITGEGAEEGIDLSRLTEEDIRDAIEKSYSICNREKTQISFV